MSLTNIVNPNLHTAYTSFTQALGEHYNTGEAKAIADRLVAYLLGLKPHQRILQRDRMLSEAEYTNWQRAQERLLTGEPIQYTIGHEVFRGLQFQVDKRVLIPRPETEELVQLALEWLNAKRLNSPGIVEFGTGSGCIAISLAAECQSAKVLATDISTPALTLAKSNLEYVVLQLEQPLLLKRVEFCTHDLFTSEPPSDAKFELLLSNPPYIPVAESETLHANVIQHEPHLALFVEDEDTMAPYRQLAHFADLMLTSGGRLLVELHAPMANQVANVFLAHGLKDIKVLKDQFGRERFAAATRA